MRRLINVSLLTTDESLLVLFPAGKVKVATLEARVNNPDYIRVPSGVEILNRRGLGAVIMVYVRLPRVLH